MERHIFFLCSKRHHISFLGHVFKKKIRSLNHSQMKRQVYELTFSKVVVNLCRMVFGGMILLLLEKVIVATIERSSLNSNPETENFHLLLFAMFMARQWVLLVFLASLYCSFLCIVLGFFCAVMFIIGWKMAAFVNTHCAS